MKYNFYILKSLKTNRYYIGSTSNLEKRLLYHNSGRVKSTKTYAPWKLIYSESFDTKSMASRREMQVKSWKSRSAIEKLVANMPLSSSPV